MKLHCKRLAWAPRAQALKIEMLRVGMSVLSCLAAGYATAQNPVLPGDHPDPSIIRVGETYWTTSTSGDWSPQFPLYRSSDLHNWRPAGAVFPHQPLWAAGSFWAPELVYDRGRVILYYVGRKRDGPLCVAGATARRPEGPYVDHGPIVCEADGSIDPAFSRDEHGAPFLIWKEDGNSIGKPTPIWAQPLSNDLLHVTGTKTQLLVNDRTGWEGGVVEAPYVLRHAGMFYMFYAGNACCGTECKYAEGVARAPHLLGPWTKDPANPIIRPNGTWRCPGHGSAVSTPDGQDYFLYHAYPAESAIYLGRESVLDRVDWGTNGWPAINAGKGPGASSTVKPPAFEDKFLQPTLAPGWRWYVNHEPAYKVKDGVLMLTPMQGDSALIARSLLTPEYSASVTLMGGTGSLAVIGNINNLLALGRATGSGKLTLSRQTGKGTEVLWTSDASPVSKPELRVVSQKGAKQLTFSFRESPEAPWIQAGEPVDVSQLPQWDQGLGIGLLVSGAAGSSASFRNFELTPDASHSVEK